MTGEVSPREGQGERQDEQLWQQRVRRETEVEAHRSVRHRVLQEVLTTYLYVPTAGTMRFLKAFLDSFYRAKVLVLRNYTFPQCVQCQT